METTQPEGPRTLLQASRYFADPDTCLDWMVKVRWPDGVACPRCNSKRVGFLARERRWKCYEKHLQPKFSVKVGTIFEDSPIGLDKWFVAIWLLGNCKNGVSSWELHRAIKVTQKTAWFMLQRIRLAMQQGGFDRPMGDGGGEVEADETFIGGKARNMHKDVRARKVPKRGGHTGKAIVMGILDRQTGKVRAKHVPDTKYPTLGAEIRRHVAPKSKLYTDENPSYRDIELEYHHQTVNHQAESYVRGSVHVNGIENFWSLLKRGLKGTYVSVEPFHLFRYIDEQAFRFNERKNDDGDAGRFWEILSSVAGKRVTYKQLTGKEECAPTAATV